MAIEPAPAPGNEAPVHLDDEGPFSIDSVLNRLSAARDQAIKESNRFTAISLVFVAIYAIKAAGLRADIVFLDQKVFELPYGTFLFCVLAQLSMCLAWMRSADTMVLDRRILLFCNSKWPNDGKSVYDTVISPFAWFGVTDALLRGARKGIFTGPIYYTTITTTIILFIIIYLSPSICGLYYLYNWHSQITSGDIALQYRIALSSTVLSLAWFLNSFVVSALSDRAIAKR